MKAMSFSAIILGSSLEDLPKKLNEAAGDAEPERFSSADNLLQLLGLCLILALILVAAYYTSRFIGRYKMGQLKDSNIQVIEAFRISPNKMLQIVRIANRYVVLGISKDQITYITELDGNEVVTHDVQENGKLSFREVFEKLKGKNSKG
ncbi:MAG: flagellar biosynthetic protein FliO [Clostridiales bacterium]|jgi:flagellar protein FliO/FliZ|nr:flagellar biosynthetic protein FliO [Clostridiales bacterium]